MAFTVSRESKRLLYHFLGVAMFTLVCAPVFSQYYLVDDGSVVVHNEDDLAYKNPWVGGLIHGHAAEADLNGDGRQDVVLFDKSGNRWITYLREESGGLSTLRHAPALEAPWPAAEVYALVRDYDGDGDADVLTYRDAGPVVWRNLEAETGTVSFSPYNGLRYLRTEQSGVIQSLQSSGLEMPAFADADGDGDLDILLFDADGAFVTLHSNQSLERYGHRDSLVFIAITDCWGRFRENPADAGIILDSCRTGLRQPDDASRAPHLGSAICLADIDGDETPDLLVGDNGSARLVFLRANGLGMDAVVDSVDLQWPALDVPVNTPLFAAAFPIDADADGRMDIVVSPNAIGLSDDHRGMRWYRDTASSGRPAFVLASNAWLQADMLDFGASAGPVASDIDQDGDMDLFVGNAGYRDASGPLPARIAWLENTGSANPRFRLRDTDYANTAALGLRQARPAFGDLDGDGDKDLLVGDENGTLHWYRNEGSTGSPDWVYAGADWQGIDAGSSAVPQWLDVDGDGLSDLLVGEKNGNLNYYRNTGTSTAPNLVLQDGNWGDVDVRDDGLFGIGYSAPWAFRNPTGAWDLLVGSAGGGLYFYDGIDATGGGPFNLYDSTFGDYRSSRRSMPSFADFDGDGRYDLVVGTAGGGLRYFRGTGATGALPAPAPTAWFLCPNPAKDQTRLCGWSSDETRTWLLLDPLGRIVQKGLARGQSPVLSLGKHPAGWYWIRLSGESKAAPLYLQP